jgi:hypothetical protein
MRSSTDANPRLGFRGYEPCVLTSDGTAFWDTGWNTTVRQGISGEKVRLFFRQTAQPRIDVATSVLVVLILATLGD